MPDPRELLDRLESRHDELIRKLDELNGQIETALAQFGKAKDDSNPGRSDCAAGGSSEQRASRRAA